MTTHIVNTLTPLMMASTKMTRPALEEKLKRKIKSLQQQLRRTKAKQQTMADAILMNTCMLNSMGYSFLFLEM